MSNRMAVSDFQGLGQLKVQAQANAPAALKETAQQFEALFVQTMLKTMRASQHYLEEDSPFRSQSEDTFQEMLDAQYAQIISQGQGIGLAKALEQQLKGSGNGTAPDAVAKMHQTKAVHAADKPRAEIPDTIQNFVQELWPHAKKIASVLGLDPAIVIAQAALETGWGQYMVRDENGSSSFNLFNIKASEKDQKNALNIKTTEYLADKPVKLNQWFKRYTSMEESFTDYLQLISGSERYTDALQHGGNSRLYIQGLQKAGYASDPHYAQKVIGVYEGPHLQQAIAQLASKAL
ncbi:MAG: glucosaminidase domain-containing protein [Legionellaceae bacterium]|nr:glucosaminidase domain-containing protein [Legionellaceae bacterium]